MLACIGLFLYVSVRERERVCVCVCVCALKNSSHYSLVAL